MSRFLSLLAIAGFGALLSTPAMAQEMPEHGVFIMNSLLSTRPALFSIDCTASG